MVLVTDYWLLDTDYRLLGGCSVSEPLPRSPQIHNPVNVTWRFGLALARITSGGEQGFPLDDVGLVIQGYESAQKAVAEVSWRNPERPCEIDEDHVPGAGRAQRSLPRGGPAVVGGFSGPRMSRGSSLCGSGLLDRRLGGSSRRGESRRQPDREGP